MMIQTVLQRVAQQLTVQLHRSKHQIARVLLVRLRVDHYFTLCDLNTLDVF